MPTEAEVLEFFNSCVRSEKGNRVTINSSLRDADLDSFGITTLLLDLDERYGYFNNIPDDEDPFSSIPYDTITVKEIIDTCISTSTTT